MAGGFFVIRGYIMSYKKLFIAALTLCVCVSSCSQGESSEVSKTESSQAETSEIPSEPATEELIPPSPAEATDPNTITFDDEDFSFAHAQTADKDSAQGTLEITEIQGNKMLRFTDDGTAPLDEKVQKIQFDAAKMLSPENMAKVRSIEFDAYADATADKFVNDNNENVKAPGWIGGGGGANVSGDKWYDFSEWSGGEYNFDMSGAVHVKFKFLLAKSGQCWDETMTEATFMVMRWGAKNEGNFYIDNIVFYDEDGNSLPIEISDGNNAEISEDNAEIPEDTSDISENSEDTGDADIDELIGQAEEQISQYESQAQEAIEEATELINELQ